MISSAEIQMIRNADPGAILPGIDTPTGNPDPASSLMSYTQITQNAKGAPYYYVPANNEVIVTQSGAVLSGINFGSATLAIEANNVTVEDCTFTATTSFWTISQTPGYSGATIEDSTFQGSGSPTEINVWINATQSITIKDNTFLDSPTDAIDFAGGVVTGNYFSGAGFCDGSACGCDPDVGCYRADHHHRQFHRRDLQRRVRRPGEQRHSHMVPRGQYQQRALCRAITCSGEHIPSKSVLGHYPMSNVSVTDNYIGFSEFGPYYGTIQNYASVQGNTLVAYSNPASSAQALAAYEKTAILPANVIAATAAGQVLTSTASTPTTLLGDSGTTFVGSTNETNFVSGYDAHLHAGRGRSEHSSLSSPSRTQPPAPTTRSRILTRPRTSSTSAASTPTSRLPGFSISRSSALPHSVEPAPKCAIS